MSELEKRCVDALDGCEAHIEDDSEAIAIVRAVLAEAGVQELVEALKPFANVAQYFDRQFTTEESDKLTIWNRMSSDPDDNACITLRQVRAARAALTKIGANQ